MRDLLVDVMGGCKICGRRLRTRGSPLVYRTCDDCKAKQRREQSRRLAAKRKAERHVRKQVAGVPRCQHCGKPIEGAVRFSRRDHETFEQWLARYRSNGERIDLPPPPWARKFCNNTCRQAAFRSRQKENEKLLEDEEISDPGARDSAQPLEEPGRRAPDDQGAAG